MLSVLETILAEAVARLTESPEPLGRPGLIEHAASESARLFHGYSRSQGPSGAAHAAAVAFLSGRDLSPRETDLVAPALCRRLPERGNAIPLGSDRLQWLLDSYWRDAEQGELPRLTWYGLLCSYFEFDPNRASGRDQAGWEMLRAFLQKSWPVVDRESRSGPVPDWMLVLRRDPEVLTERAAHRYAAEYLQGNAAGVTALATDLAVPESSWFYQALVLDAVRTATRHADEPFKAAIPRLIQLLVERPVFRDEALVALLERYYLCRDRPVPERLRDYVVSPTVWRNPKLKAAGLATSWNRVSEDVWRMVLGWVNEQNLKDFFEILADRNKADQGRLAFWSRYLKQIGWTRLILGTDTLSLARRNRGVADLIAREEGAFARLHNSQGVLDAFIMEIGDRTIVEFSQKPNAVYFYKTTELGFDRYARVYQGTQEDLKCGSVKVNHFAGWEDEAEALLKRYGISPDIRERVRESSSKPWHARSPGAGHAAQQERKPKGARFEMSALAAAVAEFPGAYIDDRRVSGRGGRLWVVDPKKHARLDKILLRWGFRWANAREAHYYPESA